MGIVNGQLAVVMKNIRDLSIVKLSNCQFFFVDKNQPSKICFVEYESIFLQFSLLPTILIERSLKTFIPQSPE